MHKAKLAMKLTAVFGLVVLNFLGACAAYYWSFPADPTEVYLAHFGHSRTFPVMAPVPGPDWIFSGDAFIEKHALRDWRIHICGRAFGLLKFERSGWSVWLGGRGY